MAPRAKKDELKVLIPDVDLTVGGEKIVLRPFPFGAYPKVIGLLGELLFTVMNALTQRGDVPLGIDLDEKGDLKVTEDTISFVFDLFSNGGDNILEIMGVAAGKEREWVDKLEGDDGLLLLAMTIKVNYDFFDKRLSPAFKKLATNLSLGEK